MNATQTACTSVSSNGQASGSLAKYMYAHVMDGMSHVHTSRGGSALTASAPDVGLGSGLVDLTSVCWALCLYMQQSQVGRGLLRPRREWKLMLRRHRAGTSHDNLTPASVHECKNASTLVKGFPWHAGGSLATRMGNHDVGPEA